MKRRRILFREIGWSDGPGTVTAPLEDDVDLDAGVGSARALPGAVAGRRAARPDRR
ncbi:hypothetical protein OOK43_30830 [[Kitasatospora] papulosa]|uniref:hypothetical protein n=1 Tax=Streptomyces TaxID=1883 RepID=UPI000304FD12|nr:MULTISPECIES: hypothetical protein [Streptomyces]MDF9874262.1 hypothetical protein [Streptomyces pratensis]MCX4417632.1 hypothetical protein [[Kitasatospora] papulosa]MCY1649818.1 hypothetical protein [Streptomyces sp. SL203]MDF6060678.1 hypothetical protein [Streptomyces sp. JH010]MDX2618015.1 hypothetical protein [Streptomyces sp. WI03-5b]